LIDAFEEKREAIKDEATPLTATSWSDLKLHNEFTKRYLNAILVGLNGDVEQGLKLIEEISNWIWGIEESVQERWDMYTHLRHLPIWYERIINISKAEAENKVYSDIVGGAGEEGVQG
jgi:hypothetical protein